MSALGRMSDGTWKSIGIAWSATGGTISSSGLYVAGQVAGSYRIIAQDACCTLADTSVALVGLSAVELTPATVGLQPAQTQQFAAQGLFVDGIRRSVPVTYTATGGTITAAGLYTAGNTPGTYRVIATLVDGVQADTAVVTVSSGPVLQAVVVKPASASVVTGATFQFTAEGRMSDGATQPVSVVWSATGGTITTSGMYTAGGTPGTFAVIARQAAGTLADTSTVTVSTAPPPPNPSCSNEPAGLTLISNQRFTAVPPVAPAKDAAGWTLNSGTTAASFAIVPDAGAPSGDGQVIAGLFPKGSPGGSAPFRMDLWFPQVLTTVYQCLFVKHSSNFTDNGNVMNKFSYFFGDNTNHFWGFHGVDFSGQYDSFIPLVALQSTGATLNRNLYARNPANSATEFKAKPLGVWRKYELLVQGPSDYSATGRVRMWVDGLLVIDRSDVRLWESPRIPGFRGLGWNPNYGGGLNPVPYDMWEYVDTWYVTGR